jgi:hypothetical protein
MSLKKIAYLADYFEIKLKKEAMGLFETEAHNYLHNIYIYSEHCLKLLQQDERREKLLDSHNLELNRMQSYLEKLKAILMKRIEEVN